MNTQVRASRACCWRRIESTLGVLDAALGITVTVVLAAVIMASGTSVPGIVLIVLALTAHVQIALFARRHAIRGNRLDLWGLACAIGVQFGIALVGLVSFGILYAPAILLSVILLIVAFIRHSWAGSRSA